MVENIRYDYSPIIGRPVLRWPNGDRVALWVVINIEHFKFDEPGTCLYPPPPDFPDVLNYGWRDYGPRVGIWRLMKMLDEHEIRACVALNSDVCVHNPLILEEGVKRGWEFLGHGTSNSQLLNGMDEEEERETIRTTIRAIQGATGESPMGWLSPGLAETYNTPDLLAEEGIGYLCDWCNDDQPYPMRVRRGRLLSVPYSLEVNDVPAFLGFGYSPDMFRRIICDQFDILYEEGQQTGRVMAIALHPFLIGQPFRIKYLAEALQHIKKRKGVWFATGSEIADWYWNDQVN